MSNINLGKHAEAELTPLKRTWGLWITLSVVASGMHFLISPQEKNLLDQFLGVLCIGSLQLSALLAIASVSRATLPKVTLLLVALIQWPMDAAVYGLAILAQPKTTHFISIITYGIGWGCGAYFATWLLSLPSSSSFPLCPRLFSARTYFNKYPAF